MQGEATVWLSTSFLSCKVSAGVFATRGQIVTSGIGVGSRSDSFTFDTAQEFTIAKKNGPTTGSIMLSIGGVNLGTFALTLSARIGDSSAENSRWVSLTTLFCRVSAYVW